VSGPLRIKRYPAVTVWAGIKGLWGLAEFVPWVNLFYLGEKTLLPSRLTITLEDTFGNSLLAH